MHRTQTRAWISKTPNEQNVRTRFGVSAHAFRNPWHTLAGIDHCLCLVSCCFWRFSYNAIDKWVNSVLHMRTMTCVCHIQNAIKSIDFLSFFCANRTSESTVLLCHSLLFYGRMYLNYEAYAGMLEKCKRAASIIAIQLLGMRNNWSPFMSWQTQLPFVRLFAP